MWPQIDFSNLWEVSKPKNPRGGTGLCQADLYGLAKNIIRGENMLRTSHKEIIIDIILQGDFARCQFKGVPGWHSVPYSAIEWVSADWID